MAKDASEAAGKALMAIETHERVCAERFLRIEGWVNLIFKILGWAGPSLVALLVSIIFMLLHKTP